MIPAQQRLHPDNFFGLKPHLRLIDEIEFIALQCPAQIIFQLEAFFGLHLHGRYIAADLHVLLFGVMYSRIRILDQLFRCIPITRVDTHTETQ
ncbi:hypothetical protein D3C75_1246050 [compost metagenome]